VWGGPRWRRRRHSVAEARRVEASLPEAVDLLALAVGSGCNVILAVEAAGRRGTGTVSAELDRVATEVRGGRRLAEALDAMADRVGETVRPLASALSGCERYGAALVPTLERLGDEVRRHRQRRAEEAARKVPVLLVFPLVLCILPAFALLTVAPLVAGALGQLRL
ncbi:MAG: type II secretion system F family protein, partial [Acidimicrobiales bacterium]